MCSRSTSEEGKKIRAWKEISTVNGGQLLLGSGSDRSRRIQRPDSHAEAVCAHKEEVVGRTRSGYSVAMAKRRFDTMTKEKWRARRQEEAFESRRRETEREGKNDKSERRIDKDERRPKSSKWRAAEQEQPQRGSIACAADACIGRATDRVCQIDDVDELGNVRVPGQVAHHVHLPHDPVHLAVERALSHHLDRQLLLAALPLVLRALLQRRRERRRERRRDR
eukprot:254333-Pleurochrysis_carterae.AAC.1